MFRSTLSAASLFAFIIFSSLLPAPAHAQDGIQWGIRGEVGVSSFRGETDALVREYERSLDASESDLALMTKYSVGGVLFVPLTSRLRFEPMVSVEETGAALQATRPDFGFFTTEETLRSEISAYYTRLTLPLAVHTEISESWTLRAAGGPILRRRIAGDHRVAFPSRDPAALPPRLELEDWDAGVAISAGIETPLADGTLILDVGVDLGVTDIASLDSSLGNIAPQHRAFHFGFGYRFAP